jgi:hypothetical protein
MKTEDDTYRVLCKPDYNTMLDIWSNSDLIKQHGSNTYSEDVNAFFRKHGWSVWEYIKYGEKVAEDRQ